MLHALFMDGQNSSLPDSPLGLLVILTISAQNTEKKVLYKRQLAAG
jgi:hypothetical protein